MTDFEDATPENPQGQALFQELLWVHRAVRRDLEVVERLAAEVMEGRPSHEVRAEIEGLQTNGPLWQLKVNCLRYCSFVHSHHNAEDAMLFPALRAANPALGPVVDKLEADHRTVSDLLDDVEAGAPDLADEDDSRRRVADTLEALHAELLSHLDYEELNVEATMRRMSGLSAR